MPDPSRDEPAVGFQLRFAGTSQADAAFLPLQVSPPADQSRREVLELRELDLQLAFEGSGPLREDVEDEPVPVEHARIERRLEIAFLARAQRVIQQDQFRVHVPSALENLVNLALPDEEARVGALAACPHFRDDGCARRLR